MPYSAGTAFLTVVPSFVNIQRAMEKEVGQMAESIDDALSQAIPDGMREGFKEAGKIAQQEGRKVAENFAGQFAGAVKKHFDAAAKSFPKVEVTADTSAFDQQLQQMRKDLETLRDAKLGVDLDEGDLFAEVARLKQVINDLDGQTISVEVRSNLAAAREQLEALGGFYEEFSPAAIAARQKAAAEEAARAAQDAAREARVLAAETGERYGGAFATTAARRITAAMKSFGTPIAGVRLEGVEAQVEEIRQELEKLSHVDIDIDIPASSYLHEINALEKRLEEIENNTIDVKVRSNVRQARAEIQSLLDFARGGDAEEDGAEKGREFGGAFADAATKAIKAGLATLPDIELNANSSDAEREIAAIRAQLRALSDVEVGVDVDAADAFAQMKALSERAQLLSSQDIDIEARTNLLAFMAEMGAVQAMINRLDGQDIDVDVDVDSGIANLRNLADTAGISMSRLGMMISLGASLGTAIVPAAAAAAGAISAIATAAASAGIGIGVLGLGLFNVVGAVSALNKYQKDANKSAVSLAGAEDRVANAVDSVRSAQRSLTRAERERRQAVEALSRAQEEARRQLEDMAQSVKANSLAQRQARLDEAEAKRELDKILANPRASEEEREQARITYEQRVLQLEDLTIQQKRLAEDKKAADKAGVQGSERVLAAQERIADATEGVVAAQQQLAASQRALAAAYAKTGTAGGEALDNLQEAMDALSPAGQRFALFLFSLKDEFKGLQAAAEGGLLPGLEQGIRNLLPLMPAVEKLVGEVATTLGGIFVDFTESMKDPVWQEFFGYLAATASPTLQGMATFAINVATGIAGILNSLSGFNGSIGDGLLRWSEGFANWSRTLDQNEGWQEFLGYIREAGPAVIDFFGNLWNLVVKVVEAAAPIGLVVVQAFSKLFEWLSKLDTDTWTIIIASIAGIGAALLAVSAVTAAIGTGITGAIIAGVALVAGGLALLYSKVEPLRVLVDETVAAIGTGWTVLWESVLKPTFDAIGSGISVMRQHWDDLYQSIFVHVFSAITGVLGAFWETLKTIFRAVSPLVTAFQTVFSVAFGMFQIVVRAAGVVFEWLWDRLRPVFGFIGVAFEVLKAIFQVVFGLFQIGVKIIAAIFWWFWETAIQPVWNLLKPIFTWLGEVIEKHVVPPFKRGMEAIGKAWDLLVEAAKVPIRFLIETVLNNGLLAGYNKIAKFFKVKPDDVRIDLPQGWGTSLGSSTGGYRGFARGGKVWGEGTGTSDSIPAWLSNGEHVWTAAEVDAVGGHDMVYRLRQMALDGTIPRFATGGAVGDFFAGLVKRASDVFSGITNFFSDPLGAMKRLASQLLELVPGKDSEMVQIALGMPKRVVETLTQKVDEFFKASATTQGNPGPTGPGPGFLPWPAGPYAQRGDSGVWRNILQLVRDSGIPYHFGNSYRPGDPLWHGSGRAIDFIGYNQDALGQFFMNMQGRVLELIHTTPRSGYYVSRGQRRSSMGEQDALHRDHLHIAMDSGGLLPTGWSHIFNGTGRPEPVLTGGQWDSIMTLARGGDGASASYNFNFRDTTLDPGKLRALQDREAARARRGRAR